MATMNISLPDEMKKWIEQQCEDGTYANSSDFMRDLVRQAKRKEAAIGRLNALIDEGLESGPAEPFDFDEFRQDVRAQAEAKSVVS